MALTVKNADGTVADLTDAEVGCMIKQRYRDRTPVIVADCYVLDPKAGLVGIKIPSFKMDNLWVNPNERKSRCLMYVYDVVVRFSNGEQSRIVDGAVWLTPLVTRI